MQPIWALPWEDQCCWAWHQVRHVMKSIFYQQLFKWFNFLGVIRGFLQQWPRKLWICWIHPSSNFRTLRCCRFSLLFHTPRLPSSCCLGPGWSIVLCLPSESTYFPLLFFTIQHYGPPSSFFTHYGIFSYSCRRCCRCLHPLRAQIRLSFHLLKNWFSHCPAYQHKKIRLRPYLWFPLHRARTYEPILLFYQGRDPH